jgi:hypothetical protein
MNPQLSNKVNSLWGLGLFAAAREYTTTLKSRCDKRVDYVPYFLYGSWALKEAFEAGAVFALSRGKLLSLAQLDLYLGLKNHFDEFSSSDHDDLDLYNIKAELGRLDMKTATKRLLRSLTHRCDDFRLFRFLPLWYGWALMEAYKDGAVFAVSEGKFASWNDFYEQHNQYTRYLRLREKVSGEPCPENTFFYINPFKTGGFEARSKCEWPLL